MSVKELSTFSTEELKKDLRDSYLDIGICYVALRQGDYIYGNGESTLRRREVNFEIIVAITAELDRRGIYQEAMAKGWFE